MEGSFIAAQDADQCFAINKADLGDYTLITQASVASSCSSLGAGWSPYQISVGYNLTNPVSFPAPFDTLFKAAWPTILTTLPPVATTHGLFGITNGPNGYGYAGYNVTLDGSVSFQSVNSGGNFLVTPKLTNYNVRYVCLRN
jgi:hypothetical protein